MTSRMHTVTKTAAIVFLLAAVSVTGVFAEIEPSKKNQRELRGGRGGGSSGGRGSGGSTGGSVGGGWGAASRANHGRSDNDGEGGHNNHTPWWQWLLIALALVLGMCGLCFGMRKCVKGSKGDWKGKDTEAADPNDEEAIAASALAQAQGHGGGVIMGVPASSTGNGGADFEGRVQSAKNRVDMTQITMVPKPPQPYCGDYHVSFIDRGASQNVTLQMNFTSHKDGFLISGRRRSPDGTATQIEDGFAKMDGTAWWKERITSGSGASMGMRILSEGNFSFDQGWFAGTWVMSTTMAAGAYTTFSAHNSMMAAPTAATPTISVPSQPYYANTTSPVQQQQYYANGTSANGGGVPESAVVTVQATPLYQSSY